MCNCPDSNPAVPGTPFGEVAIGGGWTLADLASLAFVVWIGLQLADRVSGKRAR
jgi:hypothetical protein